jgi:DNA-binding beta-propeller fold protein YncE
VRRIAITLISTLATMAGLALATGPSLAASAGLTTLGVAGYSAQRAATSTLQQWSTTSSATSRTAAVPGTQLWVARYDSFADSNDDATSVTTSPSGDTVLVTGHSDGVDTSDDYATVAYSATTGAQLWVSRYNDPANSIDEATSVAVSPTGDTVFVTGQSEGAFSGFDYATVAYNATTGAQLWVSRYNGTGGLNDYARSLAVSPNGDIVFVTGQSYGSSGTDDYATVAYDATTGAQLWVKRHSGSAGANDGAFSVAVSPSGSAVFVTGQSTESTSGFDYGTVAYSATTGTRLWVRHYNGPANSFDTAYSLAVSPSGDTVFVTGESYGGSTTGDDFATVAYNAATGTTVWVKRHNGSGSGTDSARSVSASPAGNAVFVTGTSYGGSTGDDYNTVAYSAATGAKLWVRRYNDSANGTDDARSVAVSPSGGTVYITGASYGGSATLNDYATVAYSATTGVKLWVKRYNDPSNGNDAATCVAVSPTAGTVFVTGGSLRNNATGDDYATVAYSG